MAAKDNGKSISVLR